MVDSAGDYARYRRSGAYDPYSRDMVETINKLIRISRQLLQQYGRDPLPEELAKEMDIPEEKVREILKIAQEPVSLETPIGEEEDSHLGDFIPDDDAPAPAEAVAFTPLKEQLMDVLDTLTPREEKVLKLRFGLEDGRARTLEEVGKGISGDKGEDSGRLKQRLCGNCGIRSRSKKLGISWNRDIKAALPPCLYAAENRTEEFMELSLRMRAIATFAKEADIVADIGCDHGFVTAALIEDYGAKQVIACATSVKNRCKRRKACLRT